MADTLDLTEENVGSSFELIVRGKHFLNRAPLAQLINGTFEQPHPLGKVGTYRMGIIFFTISDRGLIFKICKELKKKLDIK